MSEHGPFADEWPPPESIPLSDRVLLGMAETMGACLAANDHGHNPVPPGGCPCRGCAYARETAEWTVALGKQPQKVQAEAVRLLVEAGMEMARALAFARSGPCTHMKEAP